MVRMAFLGAVGALTTIMAITAVSAELHTDNLIPRTDHPATRTLPPMQMTLRPRETEASTALPDFEIDPWQCATENLTQYYDVPKPTGTLLDELSLFGRKLRQPCVDAGTALFYCPFPPRSSWCGFSATATASGIVPAYSSYGSQAYSWWSSHSSSVTRLPQECPISWGRVIHDAIYGELWLNNTIAFAECYSEAHVTSQSITTTATACKTVSGLASPTPLSALCGLKGTSLTASGAGTIVAYGSGSPYVESLSACAAQCVATSLCSNVYFIEGSTCNLHYGPTAFNNGGSAGSVQYDFYEAACFTCPCPIVSGLVRPTPSGAICGLMGTSLTAAGAGTVVAYGSDSPYVASLSACRAQCLAMSCCSNIYFIQDRNCNLHYGPRAFNNGKGNPQFEYYDTSCFTCGELSCTTSTGSPTSTGNPTSTAPACPIVSGLVSPTPSSAICGVKGTSLSADGAGTIVAYGSDSPYVASISACSAQCLATSCCSNIYFIQGLNCNLHYGPRAFNNGRGNPQFDYYDTSCFTCDELSCTSSTTSPTSTAPACSTTSGLISPTPSGAICGTKGTSLTASGAGTLVAYGSGSPHVASLSACRAVCLATSCCSNVYFIQDINCNLHYGPRAFNEGGIGAGNLQFEYYDTSCFTCDELSCTST